MKKIFTLLFMCVFAVAAKADITVYVKQLLSSGGGKVTTAILDPKALGLEHTS